MANQRNLAIDQGTTFSANISVLDSNGDARDLTDYTSEAQFRKYYESNTYVSFTTEVSNGNINIALTANQTANITSGRYVYDVDLSSNTGTVERIVEGILTIRPMVTRI